MKNLLFILAFSIILLLSSCKEEPPVLPGLTKSKMVFITDPDSSNVVLNNKEVEEITPFTLEGLDPGFFKIDISRFSYFDTSMYYVVRRNVSDTIIIEMREDPVYWWKIINTSNSQIPTNDILKIEVDNLNNKWIGTRGSGLLKYDGSDFIVYSTSNSDIPNNYINDVFIEENGIIWVATEEGFAKFDGSKWIIYNQQNLNLPDNDITSIIKDKTGIFWLGTVNGGLIKFDGAAITIYNYFNSGLPTNYVTTITADDNNLIWIGTYGEGLTTYDGTNWKVYNSIFHGLASSFISKIIIDTNDDKWIGAPSVIQSGAVLPGGLIRFDGNNFTNFVFSPTSLPGNSVTDLELDEKGKLWISTNNGLASFDGSKWKIYNDKNSGLPSNFVSSVAVDLNQYKWVGTTGLGLYFGGK